MSYKRIGAVLLAVAAAFSCTLAACGKNGKDGNDGVGIAYVYTLSNEDGSQTVVLSFTDGKSYKFTIPASGNGKDGDDGKDGENGRDGIDGKDGSGLLSGTGLPDDGTGNENDLYIDFSTCNIYKKIDGKWQYVTNIKGENNDSSEEDVTLTLDYGYGEKQTIKVKKGESTDLPTPERSNYEFLGWYYLSNGSKIAVNSLTPFTRDITLVAEWKQIISTLPTENEIYWSVPAGDNIYGEYQPFTITTSLNANAVIFVYFPSKLVEVLPDQTYVWGKYTVEYKDNKTVVTFNFDNLKADYYALSIVALVDAKIYGQTINFEVSKY